VRKLATVVGRLLTAPATGLGNLFYESVVWDSVPEGSVYPIIFGGTPIC